MSFVAIPISLSSLFTSLRSNFIDLRTFQTVELCAPTEAYIMAIFGFILDYPNP